MSLSLANEREIQFLTKERTNGQDHSADDVNVIYLALRQLQEASANFSTYASLIENHWDDLCTTLGTQKTREELIPCLKELFVKGVLRNDHLGTPVEEHDEFLSFITAVVLVLKKSVSSVGGPEHIGCLLDLLSSVCDSTDVAIREKGINAVSELLDLAVLSNHGRNITVQYIKSLEAAASTALQLTACRVWFYVVDCTFAATDNDNLENLFMLHFARFFRVRATVVRRAAALELPVVINRLVRRLLSEELPSPKKNASLDTWVVPCIKTLIHSFLSLCTDDSEAVRLAAVQSMANTVPLLSHQSLKEEEFKVFSAFKDMADDASWVVRCTVGRSCLVMAAQADEQCFPHQAHKEVVANTYKTFAFELVLRFLQDSRVQVRMAAFVALGKDAAAKRVASSLDLHQQAVFLENLRMIVDTILTEEDQEQKVCVAEHLVAIAGLFDAEVALQHLFLPFLSCFKQNASGELPLAALHSLFPDLPSVVNMHGDGSEWLLLFPVNACLQERSPSSPSLQPVDDIRLQLLHKIQRDETLCSGSGLSELVGSYNWRLRHQLLLLTPAILLNILNDGPLHNFLVKALLAGLSDDICLIRSTASHCCVALFRFGFSWPDDQDVFVTLREVAHYPHYLLRMNSVQFQLALLVSDVLSSAMQTPSTIYSAYLYLFKLSLRDRVENVPLYLLSSMAAYLQTVSFTFPSILTDCWKSSVMELLEKGCGNRVKEAANAFLSALDSYFKSAECNNVSAFSKADNARFQPRS